MDTMSSAFSSARPHALDHAEPRVRSRSLRYRPAIWLVAGLRATKDFVAGVLIGVSVLTPVFVATAEEGSQWQQYGLPGGLALFAAGLWLRTRSPRAPITRSRNPAKTAQSGWSGLTA